MINLNSHFDFVSFILPPFSDVWHSSLASFFPCCALNCFVGQRLQVEYKRVVETYDPQAIAFFVRQNPFHADSLLQLVN